MSANKEDKKQVVESIKAKITDSKSVLFVDYKGLTVVQDTELRTAFRKNGVEYKVLKNTLVRKAFNELGIHDFDSILNGPTAVAFGKDETGASKAVVKEIEKLDNKISVKSGYIDGKAVDVAMINQLAKIPSKEELVASLAGALSGIIRGLAVALNAVAEKQQQA